MRRPHLRRHLATQSGISPDITESALSGTEAVYRPDKRSAVNTKRAVKAAFLLYRPSGVFQYFANDFNGFFLNLLAMFFPGKLSQ